MLRQILQMLNQSEWNIGDEDIDFAKGSHKIPKTLKDAKLLIRRNNGGHK